MGKTTEVRVTKGATINLGNYESARLDVTVTTQVEGGEDWGAVVEEAASQAEAALAMQMAPITAGLSKHQIETWERRVPALKLAMHPDDPIPFEIVADDEEEADTRKLDVFDDGFNCDSPITNDGLDTEDYPSGLFDGLEAVRASGKVNMLDRKGVIALLWATHSEAASWLDNPTHKDRYMEILNELGHRLGQQ